MAGPTTASAIDAISGLPIASKGLKVVFSAEVNEVTTVNKMRAMISSISAVVDRVTPILVSARLRASFDCGSSDPAGDALRRMKKVVPSEVDAKAAPTESASILDVSAYQLEEKNANVSAIGNRTPSRAVRVASGSAGRKSEGLKSRPPDLSSHVDATEQKTTDLRIQSI